MSTKYYSTFKDISGNSYLINLIKSDYSGEATELIAATEPLVIETPNTGKFEAVKGSGATLRFISSTDRQLIDLYTANYKEWQVEILRNGSTFFTGYVESELYEESFNYQKNYEVQITCNNGIGILERERFVKTDGSFYSGLTSVFTVISEVISKMNLGYSALNIATDLSINSTVISSSKSVLQYLAANYENYIDEDNIAFDSRKVLEAVLTPFSLSFFANGSELWIVDTEYLQTNTINYKSFNISGNTVNTSCTNESKSVNLDLSGLTLFDSSFTIQAGFNNYKLSKNRYVKDVISKVDFSDEENYSGNEFSNVWELKSETILTDTYDNKGTEKRYWLNQLDSFSDYTLNSLTVPNNSPAYFSALPVSYAGGIKNQKIIDGQLINYDTDETDFSNYIFITNPYKDMANSEASGSTSIAYNHYEHSLSEVLKSGFTYSLETPHIFNSDSAKIRLNYTVKIISSGILTNLGTMGTPKWDNVDEKLNKYGAWLYYTNIHFVDANNNLKYFLRLQGSENFNKDSEIPKFKDAVYELIEYTGQTDTNCLIYFSNINEAGNMVSIVNQDFTSYIDIPVNFDKIYKLKVEFLNCFFPLTDMVYLGGYSLSQVDYYKSIDEFKESFPHIGFKDISTEVITNSGETLNLEDEEIEYYLSNTYKSESESTDLLNYTAENQYLTDVAGLMISDNSHLTNLFYIGSASSNGVNKTNLEDLKGDKMIRQYKNNQVVLSLSVKAENIGLLNTLTANSDTFWNSKKWVATALNNRVSDNVIDITLEEIF